MKETVRLLAERIRELESARPSALPPIPLGCGLRVLFPKELPAGSLVELVASTGAGAWTLGLVLAKYACGERKMLLVADHQRSFYPPAAIKLGIDHRHIVIIRSPDPRDTLLAAGQALRCSAVGAVIGQFERMTERDVRRLQLAAETGGGIGVLVRPLAVKDTPSFATVRLLLTPHEFSPLPLYSGGEGPGVRGTVSHAETECSGKERSPPHPRPLSPEYRGEGRVVSVEVLRCRGDREGRSAFVEIDDETGDVRAFSELAAATHPASSA